MRLTMHNGRAGKDGAYAVKHNDRNFDISNSEHINPEKAEDNIYWNRYSLECNISFEEAEKRFYEEHFRAALDKQNRRNEQHRNYDRIKTMDEYRQSVRTCPEETLYYIGSAKDGTVSLDVLTEVVNDHMIWVSRTFPNSEFLNIALHTDEQGAPHIHERRVWVAEDKDGDLIVSQTKALKTMGIKPPDPNKPIGRYNNPKQTYTRMCRDHLLELCRRKGLEIVTEPLEKSKTGLNLATFKAEQEQMKAEQAKKTADLAMQEADRGRELVRKAHQSIDKAKRQYAASVALKSSLNTDIEVLQRDMSSYRAELESLQQQISAKKEYCQELEKEVTDKESDLGVVNELLQVRKNEQLAEIKKRARSSRMDKSKIILDKSDYEDLMYRAEADWVSKKALKAMEADRSHAWAAQAAAEQREDDAWMRARNENILERIELQSKVERYEKLQQSFPELFRKMEDLECRKLDRDRSRDDGWDR